MPRLTTIIVATILLGAGCGGEIDNATYRSPDGVFSTTRPPGWVVIEPGVLVHPAEDVTPTDLASMSIDDARAHADAMIYVQSAPSGDRTLEDVWRASVDDHSLDASATVSGVPARLGRCGGYVPAQCLFVVLADRAYTIVVEIATIDTRTSRTSQEAWMIIDAMRLGS